MHGTVGIRLGLARRSLGLLSIAACVNFGVGCSGSSSTGSTTDTGGLASTAGATNGGASLGNGGANATGGLPNTGGLTNSNSTASLGGGMATGGSASSGGAPVTGGNFSTGGAQVSGGSPAVGGTSSTGGVPVTGGSKSTGGNFATGGSQAVAGSKSTGGTSATVSTGGAAVSGGSKATGGNPATGGNRATGGNVGAGGSSPACGAPVAADPNVLSSCTGTSPITCTLTAPNGNWDVTVQLGDPSIAASSRVQAETRHYENNETATGAGSYSTLTFTANVRAEVHDGGQSAPGNILNLVIDGATPKLHSLGIRSSTCATTIFVASDSTACDWVSTNTSALAADETGWAQELSLYLKPGASVANYADSGETSGSFYTKFFPAARTAMKAGDYLLIQFGHNDQKTTTDVANYASNLTNYVNDAKAKGAIPVIVTPVSRASGTAANPGFAGLDQVARDTAAQLNVALIDLTALSRAYYATVPNFSSTLFIDGTHFHEVGAIGVAGVVANAIKSSSLGLSAYIR